MEKKLTNIFPYGLSVAGSIYETPFIHISEMFIGAFVGAVVGYFVKKGFDYLFKILETKKDENNNRDVKK